MTRVTVIGAAGRMGCALIRAAADFPDIGICGAVASANSAALGQDAGELAGSGRIDVTVSSNLADAVGNADVVVDFSSTQATHENLAACVAARKPLLIGTTGFGSELEAQFAVAARDIALLVAPNTSLGVTALIELVRAAARALPADFDIEIIEAHHRMKRDAPSGTALALGRAAAQGRQQDFERTAAMSRTGLAGRKAGEIGFAAVRGGDIVGEHSVLFAGTGERISLTHQASDRAIFARGALKAALWLAPQPPGRFFMRDIVSYKS